MPPVPKPLSTVGLSTGWTPWPSLLKAQPYAASGKVAEVESLFAHIYREASVTRHAPLITIPFESKLEVVAGTEGEAHWMQVRLPDDDLPDFASERGEQAVGQSSRIGHSRQPRRNAYRVTRRRSQTGCS